MKKLMVAGCSFSAVSKTLPGTSWSEILAEKLGWELVNIARLGCSNGGIRIQIEEIRRQQPDFAIITPTFWDRMEIPARAAPYDWSNPDLSWFDNLLQKHLLDGRITNGYNRDDGINNINYGNNNYNMICETIFSLAENFDNHCRSGKIDEQTQASVRNYVDRIYDQSWKRQMDQWIITEGVLQMFHDGLDFLVMPGILWLHASEEWREVFPKAIPDKFIVLDHMQSQYEISKNLFPIDKNHAFLKGTDPGYHTSEQGQEHIADNWYKRITTKFPETCSKYTKKRAPKNL